MKRLSYSFLILAVVGTLILYQALMVKAQEEPEFTLEVEGVICRDVVDREPLDPYDPENPFDVTVEKLFCWTKIIGAQEPIEITHVWYWGETERAKIVLEIAGSNWRTWSSKIIQPHEMGDWHVDVVGPDGEVLKTLEFAVKE